MILNRAIKRGIAAAIIAAGMASPAQMKTALYVPAAPAIIKPAKLWVPHERKLMRAMPFAGGMMIRRSGALTPSFRAVYSSTVNTSNYSFASCDLGTPHATRMVVVCAVASDTAISALVVDGTAGTAVTSYSAANRRGSMWRAASTANSSGTISMTVGSTTNCIIAVYALYPSSQTPVDSGSNTANATTVIASDIAKTNAGFTIIMGEVFHASATLVISQNGAETVIEDNETNLEAERSVAFGSHVNTATTTLDDYTLTSTVSANLGIAAASWF